jgi:hypothetical protein
MVSSFLTHTCLISGGGLRGPCWPFSLPYLASGSTTPHSYGCYWASATFSCSALTFSSLVCHSDWQEQIAANAIRGRVPDVDFVGSSL